MYLSSQDYKTAITLNPLVSIDLVIRNPAGQFLLGYRTNAPALHTWFVPGGSVRKNERLDQAFTRLSRQELGQDLQRRDAGFLGVFEHLYPDSCFGDTPDTHYVVLAHLLELDLDLTTLPRQQHREYRWFSREALMDAEDVHLHSKWYMAALD
jgi:colanic acid biosynthesis protein WcaH